MAQSKTSKKISRLRRRVEWVLRNIEGSRNFRKEVAGSQAPLADITRYERKVYSQNGEDGILEAIFARVGTTNKFLVEFGIGSGRECNTRYMISSKKWRGLWMTGNAVKKRRYMEIQREFITAENIESLFAKYEVPARFDLLSIDIDGNDYWVWKAIRNYRPRVVVIEYNAMVPPDRPLTIAYEPEFVWRKTDYMGASLLALARLGEAKGYTLIGCDSWGTNAFFVENEFAGQFATKTVAEFYRAPLYHDGKGHPADPERKMIEPPDPRQEDELAASKLLKVEPSST